MTLAEQQGRVVRLFESSEDLGPRADQDRHTEANDAADLHERHDGSEDLASGERQVVSLVVAGATNAEAARALYVSPKTVEHHLSSVYRKLALRSRTELVRRWLDTDGGA